MMYHKNMKTIILTFALLLAVGTSAFGQSPLVYCGTYTCRPTIASSLYYYGGGVRRYPGRGGFGSQTAATAIGTTAGVVLGNVIYDGISRRNDPDRPSREVRRSEDRNELLRLEIERTRLELELKRLELEQRRLEEDAQGNGN